MPSNKVKSKNRKLEEIVGFLENHKMHQEKIYINRIFLRDLILAMKHALFLEKKHTNITNKLLLAKLKLHTAVNELAFLKSKRGRTI